MQHMALLALEDHEVDLLSRVRQRDDVRLGAVYHPDPAALVVRLAGLAHVPVVFDIEALAALPIDFCVGGEKAAPAIRELIGRASREGKPAPVFVRSEDFDLYLKDPPAYASRHGAQTAAPKNPVGEINVSPSAPRGAGESEVYVSLAGKDDEPPVPVDTEGPTARIRIPAELLEAQSRSLSRENAGSREDASSREDVAVPPITQGDGPADEAGRSRPETSATRDVRMELGMPPLRDLFDPTLLSRWIAETALKTGEGFAAVLWRREADGQRFSLMSFAPDADQLPTTPFPPAELELHVRAGGVRVVDPPRTSSGDGPSPLKLLVAPLPGDRGPFGLLGVFRRTSEGAFSESFRTAIAGKAEDYGVALERSVDFSGMGAELRSLRFKERVRDLMLDSRVPVSERWSRLLDFLVLETQADFAQFLRLSDDRSRLSLEAAAGLSGDFEGWVSIPVGRGMVGRALGRPGVTVYTTEDGQDDRGIYLLPVCSGSDAERTPVGVIVLDGAAETHSSGEDTAALLQVVADIVSPLLKTPLAGGRA